MCPCSVSSACALTYLHPKWSKHGGAALGHATRQGDGYPYLSEQPAPYVHPRSLHASATRETPQQVGCQSIMYSKLLRHAVHGVVGFSGAAIEFRVNVRQRPVVAVRVLHALQVGDRNCASAGKQVGNHIAAGAR